MRVEERRLFVNQQHERISEKREQEYKLESVSRTMPESKALRAHVYLKVMIEMYQEHR